MGYAGWHGVCDPSGVLVAISYEPIEGTLCCRLRSGEIYLYLNVPEDKYQILLRAKFAGAYWRRKIKDYYECIPPNGIPLPIKFDDSAMKAHQAKLARQRLEAATRPEWDLFGNPLPRARRS